MPGRPTADHRRSANEAVQAALHDHRAGNLAAAESGYRRALSIDPDNASALNLLGVILHGQGRLEEADHLITRCIEAGGPFADGLANLAMVCLARGDLDRAMDAARRALAIAPTHAQARFFLGQACERTGQAGAAADSYRQVLAQQPAFVPARAALYVLQEPDGREIQALEATVAQRPDSPVWRESLDLALRAKAAALLARQNRVQADLLDLIAERVGLPPLHAALPPAPPPRECAGALLIRAWGHGFWADVDHVLGQCLLAEILGRRPIVYWDASSRYGSDDGTNAFTHFFAPIGDPCEAATPARALFESASASPLLACPADHSGREGEAAVSARHVQVLQLRRWLPPGHPLAGRPVDDICRALAAKYLQPRAERVREAEAFVHRHFALAPFIAVHLRGLDKGLETASLAPDNERLLALAAETQRAAPDQAVFVMTDDETWLARARQVLRGRIVVSDSWRSRGGAGLHFAADRAMRIRLGREIMLDTLVACRARRFFGLGASNVALAVAHGHASPGEAVTLVGRRATAIPQLMFNDW